MADQAVLDQTWMDKLPSTVSAVLDVLQDRLGTTAKVLFDSITRYVFAVGVGHTVNGVAALVVGGVIIYCAKNVHLWLFAHNQTDRCNADVCKSCKNLEEFKVCSYLLGGVLVLICTILAFDCFSDGLPLLLAPDGFALMKIVRGQSP